MNNSVFLSKSKFLKAISNAKRLEILCYIHDKELSVGALEGLVHLTQSALSQHLGILRKENIVKTRRDAQTIYYTIDNKMVKDILKLLELC